VSARPKFSFVVTSRNDDHGGDVLRRTQSFINRLSEQCERHQVPSELVLVEWNPPASRADLEDVLGWPSGSRWFSVRIVKVPQSLHSSLRCANRLSLFQMIAKNVGIRRAFGDYIIATNIDIIFSDEIFKWLRNAELRSGVLYRADRWDIPNKIQLVSDLDELLRRARTEAIRRNLKDGTYVGNNGVFENSTQSQFDFAFHNPLKHKLQTLQNSVKSDFMTEVQRLSTALGLILTEDFPRLRRNYLIPVLHTNGCGDFTMLARADWFALRGYPQWQIFSWTIDSVLIFQAFYNGIEIEELPRNHVIYHIEHAYGSGWTPEGAGSLWQRLEQRGIPYISYEQFTELVYELQDNSEKSHFTVYNGLDWGFAGEPLETRQIVGPGISRRPRVKVNDSPLSDDFPGNLRAAGTIAIDSGSIALEGVQAELRSPGFRPSLYIETRPELWSDAIYFDLGRCELRSGEHWIEAFLDIESGAVEMGLLNSDGSAYLVQTATQFTDRRMESLICYVRDISAVGRLVFRNATPGNTSARFGITAMRFLIDPGPENEPEPGELTRVPEAVPLSAIRRGSPNALIRLLRSNWYGDATVSDEQGLIITPTERGALAAVFHLHPLETRHLCLDLQVLEGELGIGLAYGSGGAPIIERTVASGEPFVRIELDAGEATAANALVVRNLSSNGRTSAVLHRISCCKTM
jgi:hypothetical protein